MAKARDIAALAGLAGLAYAMRNKDKGTTDSNPTRAARPESTETREESRRKIEDYQKKAPLDGTEMYPSGVMGGASQPASKPAAKPTAIKPAVAADEPAGLTTPVSSANRTDQLANLSRAVNREKLTKDYAQNEFNDGTRTFTSPGPYSSIQEVQKLNDTLEGRAGVSTSSARKTDAMKVASRAAAAADRQRKMAKANSYKSGGMTASSRADGIATKGKTRGKIC